MLVLYLTFQELLLLAMLTIFVFTLFHQRIPSSLLHPFLWLPLTVALLFPRIRAEYYLAARLKAYRKVCVGGGSSDSEIT